MAVPVTAGLSDRGLVALLADGQVHSGERLARSLGVSRAAVWKGIERLRADGIEIEALPTRGYQLPMALELLEDRLILAGLRPQHRDSLHTLEVRFEVDSTNTLLLQREPPPVGSAEVCYCERQSAGRGRRGRRWIAPFGQGIAMSVGWQFRGMPRDLPALGLVSGVAVARALAKIGARGIGLKWPNDIWLDAGKVGGILIDLRAEADGPVYVVIGIGLNMLLTAAARDGIQAAGTRAAAVADACASRPSRNATAAAVLDELIAVLTDYERTGFAPYRDEWAGLDVLAGRAAIVFTGAETIEGVARGIDRDGALQLDVEGRVHKFLSGDVSLRPLGALS